MLSINCSRKIKKSETKPISVLSNTVRENSVLSEYFCYNFVASSIMELSGNIMLQPFHVRREFC